jgi:hypothetical protein
MLPEVGHSTSSFRIANDNTYIIEIPCESRCDDTVSVDLPPSTVLPCRCRTWWGANGRWQVFLPERIPPGHEHGRVRLW